MTHWIVTADADDLRRGRMAGPMFDAPCRLGAGGVVAASEKREGDGASPAGVWPVRRVFYRPDKVAKPLTQLEVIPLDPQMGWCDAPDHAHYNKLVRLPFAASHEKMWRSDELYNIVVELGYNDAPAVAGKGSAIFLHVWRSQDTPTRGCVATDQRQLLLWLRGAAPGDTLEIRWP